MNILSLTVPSDTKSLTDALGNTAENALEKASTIGQQFKENFDNIAKVLFENRGNILWNLLLIVLVIIASKLILHIVTKLTSSIMAQEKYQITNPQGKRVHTLLSLLRSATRYMVYFVAFLIILSLMGFAKPLNSLIVTAGIGSLAIGFGAQNLVRDVVTGFFMIFENQFAVGDYIKIDEAEGTVEATAMRVTYLRSMKGDQIIIPNGSISRVINYTRGGSVATVTINTPYDTDTRKVIEFIDRAVQQYAEANPELIEEPPVVLGINAFSASSIDIKVSCNVYPMKQWEVERGMRLAVKEMFDIHNISFPYPHVVTVPYEPHKDIVSYNDIFITPTTNIDTTEWGNISTEKKMNNK